MCHRYIQTSDLDALRQDLTFTGAHNLSPRHNIRPLQQVPVLHAQVGGTHLTMMRWGMTVPDLRSDVVTELDAQFLTQQETGRPLLEQRCLIPADGFYECEKRAGRRLQPWLVRLIEDGPFCFGGIWQPTPGQPSRASSHEAVSAGFECALLTVPDNGTIAPIAFQVPVILAKQDYATWLDRRTSTSQIHDLLKPYRDSGIYWHPVSAQLLETEADMPWLAEPAQMAVA
jgi:putative SOS response-associated peptidase YedK